MPAQKRISPCWFVVCESRDLKRSNPPQNHEHKGNIRVRYVDSTSKVLWRDFKVLLWGKKWRLLIKLETSISERKRASARTKIKGLISTKITRSSPLPTLNVTDFWIGFGGSPIHFQYELENMCKMFSKNVVAYHICYNIWLLILPKYITKELFTLISLTYFSTHQQSGLVVSHWPTLGDWNTLTLKVIRLNSRDFSRIHFKRRLCKLMWIRSFNSARIINDAVTLHSLSH